MLTGLQLKLAAFALGRGLKAVARSKDHQTTMGGVVAAVAVAVLSLQGLDLAALLQGDAHQIYMVALAVVSSLALSGLAWLATKANADGKASMLGLLAGAAQLALGNVTTAVALLVTGYLTNKPVAQVAEAEKEIAAGAAEK